MDPCAREDAFMVSPDASTANSMCFDHPFARIVDDPRHSPPALIQVLRARAPCDDPLLVARIEAIHRMLERTRVPHVLPLHAVGRTAAGELELSYRRIDGENLGDVVRGGPLPLPRVFAVLRQILHAMTAAHAAGIDHRALGPASVMLTRRGGTDDCVSVMDFGLAPLFDDDDDSGCIALHPMTPEKVLGGETDASEDVYLVGCLAYWMLTGAPPFAARDIDTLRRRHAIEDAKRVSKVRRDPIPVALDDAVATALEKYPDDRYPDLAVLEGVIAEAQAQAAITTPWDRETELSHISSAGMLRAPRLPAKPEPTPIEAEAPAASEHAPGPTSASTSSRSVRLPAIVSALALAVLSVGLLANARDDEPATIERATTSEHDSAPVVLAEREPTEEVTAPRTEAEEAEPPAEADPVAEVLSTPALDHPPALAVATPPPPATHAATRPPDRPPPSPRADIAADPAETCELLRRAVADARNAHDWAGLLRNLRRGSCWPNAERTRLRVKALMELGMFAECAETGASLASRDVEVERWVRLCEKRAEARP